jgi:hypothetical protein
MNKTQAFQMAVIKRIVVLANSIKNSGRCLAGKELLRTRGGWDPGGWVRVVGTEDGGEVPVSWMLEQFGREPKLLDIGGSRFGTVARSMNSPSLIRYCRRNVTLICRGGAIQSFRFRFPSADRFT